MLHWRSKRTQAFTVSLWLAAIMWPTFLGLVIWLIFDISTHQTKLIWLVYRGTKSKPCNKFKRCLNNTQHLTLLTAKKVHSKTHLTKIVSFYWYVFKQCHLFKGISHFMWSIPRRQQDNSNRNEKKTDLNLKHFQQIYWLQHHYHALLTNITRHFIYSTKRSMRRHSDAKRYNLIRWVFGIQNRLNNKRFYCATKPREE